MILGGAGRREEYRRLRGGEWIAGKLARSTFLWSNEVDVGVFMLYRRNRGFGVHKM